MPQLIRLIWRALVGPRTPLSATICKSDFIGLMQYIDRHLSSVCLKDLEAFPILTLTGPRQSGKSTMLKHLLKGWAYVSLEEPSSFDFASEDPAGFIRANANHVIIDEIQRVPRLLSQIQVAVDENRKPGRYAISGSHNLALIESVSQSLAGRTSVRHLLPFSLAEIERSAWNPSSLNDALISGSYPVVL